MWFLAATLPATEFGAVRAHSAKYRGDVTSQQRASAGRPPAKRFAAGVLKSFRRKKIRPWLVDDLVGWYKDENWKSTMFKSSCWYCAGRDRYLLIALFEPGRVGFRGMGW